MGDGRGGKKVTFCDAGFLTLRFLWYNGDVAVTRSFLFSVIFSTRVVCAGVIINEIHYHPVEEPAFNDLFLPVLNLSEDLHEFIELYNDGDTAISLDGWRFSKGVTFVFPSGTSIEPGGYLVLAKDPDRLLSLPAYSALTETNTFGPWDGTLKNSGERILLEDSSGKTIDEVTYSGSSPWPMNANALGETRRWPNLDLSSIQYLGSSLERISSAHPGNTPENWQASDPSGSPSPGHENSSIAYTPAPIVEFHKIHQASDREPVIRPNAAAEVICSFSREENFAAVEVEYFLDDVEVSDETISAVTLNREVLGERVLYRGEIPGQSESSIVRYRIKATRSEGEIILAPRSDDPFDWYAYSPWNGATNGDRYEIHYSVATQNALSQNRQYDPVRLSDNADFGPSRSEGWNGTEPGIFVKDGEVWDVHLRYQGSPYFRWFAPFSASVPPLKIKFPRDHRMKGQRAILLTNKNDETLDAHRLFQHLGLPISTARRITATANGGNSESMIELGGMNEYMLEKFHEREEQRNEIEVPDDPGWLVKSSGLLNQAGPWGRGDGIPLTERAGYPALERYSWTYPTKNQDWRGYVPFHEMLVAHPGTLGSSDDLQDFFNARWHIPQALTYYAVAEWARFWDDGVHNYFYYRSPSGKWMVLPWDFDDVFKALPPRSHIFERTIKRAFPQAYADKLYELNNTILHSRTLAQNGINHVASEFAITRMDEINTELNLSEYRRPDIPVVLSPLSGGGHYPGDPLQLADYSHPSEFSHAATLWEIRHAHGDYLSPIYRAESSTALTSLPLPADLLRIGERYFWRATFIDSMGHRSHLPYEFQFSEGASSTSPGALRFREVVAHNSITTSHDGLFPDWVEIENILPVERSLTGVTLLSDSGGPTFSFDEEVKVAPNSSIIVWLAAPQVGATGHYSGFPISREGDSLRLLSADGTQLDAVSFGPQPDATSLERDANRNWKLSRQTPQREIQPLELGPSSALRITEWLAAPNDGDDWIELYNSSPLPVSLTGLSLEDQSGQSTVFPEHSFLAGGSYLQLFASGNSAAGADHLGFSLKREEDEIRLRDASGTIIDAVTFWNQKKGISEGRLNDLVSIARFTIPNPGERNLESDRDTDGIPDLWETNLGLNPDNATDASLDQDSDGFTSLEEYSANTDPFDRTDFLSAEIERNTAGMILLSFTQKQGRRYLIEELTPEGTWTSLETLTAATSSQSQIIPLPEHPDRVYRVRTLLP